MGDLSSQKQSQQKDREKESEHRKDQIDTSQHFLAPKWHATCASANIRSTPAWSKNTLSAKQGREEAVEKTVF